ncbi:Phospholipid ABC transporter ATP-binding protein MlaF [hydrothermal vent metagenome]|uniref:Phospholipid ABC transporter ATP-binding protein MlaF n=1 Tax=hydrothermal vent metagenome TaxID=652676 RepID=A0A3B0ZXI9_9ZZZZ
MDALVKIDNVHLSYNERPLFSGLDIEIERGKITTIMGPSGSGKTTLLRLITGQTRPDSGEISVDNLDLSRLPQAELFELRKRMGMMFQSSALFTDLTVFENVAYPLREHTDLSDSLIHLLVLLKLNSVGLRGARNLMPNELSGGMVRRVALARAIALDPMMILYDDPFSGQDPVTLGVVIKMIRSLNEHLNITSIIVSHDVDEVMAISDYIYMIHDGKVQEQGSPASMKKSDQAMVVQFIRAEYEGPVPFQYPAAAISKDLHF